MKIASLPLAVSVSLAVVLCCEISCAAPAEKPAEKAAGKAPLWSPDSGKPPVAGDQYLNPKDGSRLAWIPGGEFTLGSDKGDEDERPTARIKIKGFWLGVYEVTNRQYGQYLEAENAWQPLFWDEKGYNDPDQPVVGMIWEMAMDYCDWAGVRLPTEAEWEYAAAGGKQLEYPTATGLISHDLANFRGVGGRDKWEGPAPVGSFPPNPFGLYDLAGNAWEFTSSIWKPYPYVNDGSRENLVKDNREMQVLRGGSYGFSEGYCRTAKRRRFASHLTYDFAGFRVALNAEKVGAAAGSGVAGKK